MSTVTRRTAGRRVRGSRAGVHGLAAFIAASAVLLAYANALNNPFVYDDHETVVANPSIAAPMNPAFVLVHSPFRPVVNASYALDRSVWGYRPFGFHLTNLVLHAGVAILLYVLILRALGDVRRRSDRQTEPGEADAWVACFAVTLFGVHPMTSESVAYVSGRSELLCAFFFLASLLCGRSAMLWFNRRADPRLADVSLTRSPWPSIAGAAVFALLALMSKEVAVGLPVVLLAYDWLVLPGDPASRRRRFQRLFLPLGALTMTVAAYRLASLLKSQAEPLAAPHLNLLTQTIVIWRYLGMLLVPVGQSIMHGVRQVRSVLDPIALASVLALAAVAWSGYRVRRDLPLVTLGTIWFFAALAPSSSIVSLREGMAEHRVYFAAAGLAVGIAGAASAYFERRSRRGRVVTAYTWLAAGVVVVLCSMTIARNAVWSDPVRLWRQAVERAPGMWEPYYALGDSLRTAGDCAAAVPQYQTVVRLRPGHRDAHTNLGICLAQTGRFAEAEAAFHRAIEIDPRFARSYTNLAALAITTGDYDRARVMYLAAIEVDTRNVFARMQLARLYEDVFEDYHEAAGMCGEARAIQPFTTGVVECVERNRRLAAARDEGR